jgi:hypothetical protein
MHSARKQYCNCCPHGKSFLKIFKGVEERQMLWQSLSMHQTVIYVLVGALIAWRLYRRIRRNIGRQKLRPRRAVVGLVIVCMFILCVSSGLIIFAGFQLPRLLAGFGGGILCGALMGLLGLRLTRFETTDEGHFYTPDTRVGVGLSLLLVGRLIYRMILVNNTSYAPDHPPPMQSPLTFFIIGLTLGYSLVYYIGLLIHTHDKNKQQNTLPPADSI